MSGVTETELPDLPDAPGERAVGPQTPATTPAARGVSYQMDPQFQHVRPKRHGDNPLDAANRALARLTEEPQLSEVERSNLFDDWKEALTRAAETGLARSQYQRQIVGALLSSTRKKDVVDFTAQQLKAFRTTTNSARATPVAIDVSRAIRILTEHGLLRPLALSPDAISEGDTARLQSIIEKMRST